MQLLLMLVGFAASLVVVVDMFKLRTIWGFAGLFLIPLTPLFHVVRYYTGKKRVMFAGLIVVGFALPYISIRGQLDSAKKALTPMLQEFSKRGINCTFSNKIITSAGIEKYFVLCSPAEEALRAVPYRDAEEMTARYRTTFIEPLLPVYQQSFGAIPNKGLVLGLTSPSNIVSCFEIHSPGNIAKAFQTGLEKPCDLSSGSSGVTVGFAK